MSLAMDITDSATPALNRLAQKIGNRGVIHGSIATALKRQVQNHFLARPQNKRGWPTTNFWPRAAKSTSSAFDEDFAEVSINQIGVRQRYYGGMIRPVKAKAITIPISPEAYGKTASDFPGAFMLKTKKGAYIVQRGEEFSAKGKIKSRFGQKSKGLGRKRVVAALEFLFKLSAGVYQEPDASVLPDDKDITATALAEVERHAEAALQ